MPARVTFKIDMREFNAALGQYMAHTKRSLPDVINKKAFYVARRAVRETPATNKQAITSSLGSITHRNGGIRMKLTNGSYGQGRGGGEAPLAALIINARRGTAGEPGLYGAAMTAEIASLIAARSRSRAFLKSGWLPAIKALENSFEDHSGTGAAPRDGRPAIIGAPKGNATLAKAGFTVKARIENAASGDHETNQALVRYGGPALQRAVDFEAASMTAEVARRQFQEARKAGIKAFAT